MKVMPSRLRPVPPKHTPELRKILLPLSVFALAIGCGAGGSNGEGTQVSEGPQGTQASQDRSSTVPRDPEDPGPPAGTAWVIFGADTVRAELANTADLRARGLMYRDQVPP